MNFTSQFTRWSENQVSQFHASQKPVPKDLLNIPAQLREQNKYVTNITLPGAQPEKVGKAPDVTLLAGSLKEGKNPGKIHLTVVTTAQKMVGITFKGLTVDRYVLIIALYGLEKQHSIAEISRLLGIGNTVTISNPFLKIFADGNVGIRVDDPKSLEFGLPQPQPPSPQELVVQQQTQKQAQEQNPNKCALAGCLKEGVSRCGNCYESRYCTREHQREDWKDHKKLCGKFKHLPLEAGATIVSSLFNTQAAKQQQERILFYRSDLIETQQAATGTGRNWCAIKNIEAGTMLLVESPLISVATFSEQPKEMHRELILHALSLPIKHTDIVKALSLSTNISATNPNTNALQDLGLAALPTGFTSKNVDDIVRIITEKAFLDEAQEDNKKHHLNLYHLTSLFRVSCAANVSFFTIMGTIIVYASKSITSGTLLQISHGPEDRKFGLPELNFKCSCEVCNGTWVPTTQVPADVTAKNIISKLQNLRSQWAELLNPFREGGHKRLKDDGERREKEIKINKQLIQLLTALRGPLDYTPLHIELRQIWLQNMQ